MSKGRGKMKIKYNLEYNYFEFYNLAQGIVNFKQSIYKDEGKMIKSFTSKGFFLIKSSCILFLLMLIFCSMNREWLISKFLTFFFASSIALTFIFYIIFILFYNSEKNKCHRGELTINKNGILDTSDDGVRIGLPWHYIEALIISDKVLCFTSKTMTFFFIENDHVNEVIEAVKTYQRELKIIDKRLYHAVKMDEKADKDAKLVNPVIEEQQVKEQTEEIKVEIKEELEPLDTEVDDTINELEKN